MDDQRLGAVLRAVRVRRRMRQEDVASAAGVSRASVSQAERGHVAQLSVETLRSIAAASDVRVELLPRWRGGDLDRMVSAGHAAMHEAASRVLAAYPGWLALPEASYAIGGERGVIDVLCWHDAARVLLVVELKTQVVDVGDLMASMDRRRRLAPAMATERGWVGARDARPDRRSLGVRVVTWVLIAEGRTNRRRVAAHGSVLGRAFPGDRQRLAAILRDPVGAAVEADGPFAGLSFLSYGHRGNVRRTLGHLSRVRPPSGSRARA